MFFEVLFQSAFVFRMRSQPRQGAVQKVWDAVPTSKNGPSAAMLEVRFERLYIQTPCLPSSTPLDYEAVEIDCSK